MTDHDIAVRAARAAFAYQCLINGIGPDDQEIEWRNNVVRRVELVGMMRAAISAIAPAIRAEGRREGMVEAAMVADAARISWHEKVREREREYLEHEKIRELERKYLELARERYAVQAATEIATAILAMAEKGPTDEPRRMDRACRALPDALENQS
jgi:hypothetical protein